MPDLYQNGVVTRPVLELLPGDLVDLQNDPIADPEGAATGEGDPRYQCEWQSVDMVIRETADCVLVCFDDGPAIGFPVDHRVEVDGEQTPEDRAAEFAARWPEGASEYEAARRADGHKESPNA